MMGDRVDIVLSNLTAKGYRGRVISVDRIQELKDEILGQRDKGLFDSEFYRVWLRVFDFEPERRLAGAESMIITAVPHPQFRIVFHAGDKAIPAIIPPTYLHYSDDLVIDTLKEVLDEGGFHVARASVPV
jgi:hypothetical protein